MLIYTEDESAIPRFRPFHLYACRSERSDDRTNPPAQSRVYREDVGTDPNCEIVAWIAAAWVFAEY